MKGWPLASPHYLILVFMVGGGWFVTVATQTPGRCPCGVEVWVLRVAAHVSLITDE